MLCDPQASGYASLGLGRVVLPGLSLGVPNKHLSLPCTGFGTSWIHFTVSTSEGPDQLKGSPL